MNRNLARYAGAILILCAFSLPAWALDGSVPTIHGDISRVLLGDGTGVVIGFVDSGVDDTHPALAGRMDAEANYALPGTNTGDDFFGHGTWVASAALGNDATYMGMAPAARYVNARVLDNSNGFPNDIQVRDGIGFAIDHGADILNLSLNYYAPTSGGTTQLDKMLDWAAYNRGISSTITVGNISGGDGSTVVRGPGSAYNGVTVGRTTADFSRVHSDSATAFTADGRMKPDVVAPGSDLTLANDDWEGAAADWDNHLNGTSFAAPHVAGLMAQQLEAGANLGLSTNPLVVKATILNSASKSVLDKGGNAWAPANLTAPGGVHTTIQPLDTDSGAGQIDGLNLSTQYLAGEQGPGLVDPIGWDLHSISNGQSIDYTIVPDLLSGSTLTATLTWFRHVSRTDDGDGIIDSGDTFISSTLNNLNLQIFKDGSLVAQSNSAKDNVEHLFYSIGDEAEYTLRVLGASVAGGAEQFSLAWWGSAVAVTIPEPTSMALAVLAALGLALSRRRGNSRQSA